MWGANDFLVGRCGGMGRQHGLGRGGTLGWGGVQSQCPTPVAAPDTLLPQN